MYAATPTGETSYALATGAYMVGSPSLMRVNKQIRLITCAFAIGTAGLATASFLENRAATANWPISIALADAANDSVGGPVSVSRTPAQDLARIREILRPTVMELANLFGVSRQAVYDWQAGSQPAVETAKQLAELARAADVFADAGLTASSQTLRRKLSTGLTLLETLRSGGSVVDAAGVLTETLVREGKQREALTRRLAGRRHTPVSRDDIGIPTLDERS